MMTTAASDQSQAARQARDHVQSLTGDAVARAAGASVFDRAARVRREPLLEVDGLRVESQGAEGGQPIIDGLSLTIGRGEVVALVGESGSGKSMTALSLLRLLPAGAAITGGSITFAGEDVLAMSSAKLNRLRGGCVAMLFQQPQV